MADFTEDFESGLGSWSLNGPHSGGLTTSTAHAVDGTHSLKVNATDEAGYLERSITGAQDQWEQVSFSLYLADWNDYYDGGNNWLPDVVSFNDGASITAWLQPDSSTTGYLAWQSVNMGYLNAGAFNTIEFNQKYGSDTKVYARVYVNGVDSGEQFVNGSFTPSDLRIGSLSAGKPTTGVDYYVDALSFTHNATPGSSVPAAPASTAAIREGYGSVRFPRTVGSRPANRARGLAGSPRFRAQRDR